MTTTSLAQKPQQQHLRRPRRPSPGRIHTNERPRACGQSLGGGAALGPAPGSRAPGSSGARGWENESAFHGIPTGNPREHSCPEDSNRKTTRTFLLVGFQQENQKNISAHGDPAGSPSLCSPLQRQASGGQGEGQGAERLSHLREWGQPSRRPLQDRPGRLRTGLLGSWPSYSATSFHGEHVAPMPLRGSS